MIGQEDFTYIIGEVMSVSKGLGVESRRGDVLETMDWVFGLDQRAPAGHN